MMSNRLRIQNSLQRLQYVIRRSDEYGGHIHTQYEVHPVRVIQLSRPFNIRASMKLMPG